MKRKERLSRREFIKNTGLCTSGIAVGAMMSCASGNTQAEPQATNTKVLVDRYGCNNCGDCIHECPYGVLTTRKIAKVVLSCADCEAPCAEESVCPTRAVHLLSSANLDSKAIVARYTEKKCTFCLACKDSCPTNAIAYETDPDRLMIDSEKCTGCGHCALECPALAKTMMPHKVKIWTELCSHDYCSTIKANNCLAVCSNNAIRLQESVVLSSKVTCPTECDAACFAFGCPQDAIKKRLF